MKELNPEEINISFTSDFLVKSITLKIHSGPGMSPEEAELLFEPFVQASPEIADRYGGFGLGLAIVRRLVDLMAGTLTVDSSPGRGTAMTVVLPLPAAGAADQRR